MVVFGLILCVNVCCCLRVVWLVFRFVWSVVCDVGWLVVSMCLVVLLVIGFFFFFFLFVQKDVCDFFSVRSFDLLCVCVCVCVCERGRVSV